MKDIRGKSKEIEHKNEYIYFLIMLIVLIIIGVMVASLFENSSYGNQLEVKDYFNYTGVLIGSISGGFISFFILKITLNNQKEQFEYERKLNNDSERIENSLLLYKDIYKTCGHIKFEISSFKKIIEMDNDLENSVHNILVAFNSMNNNLTQLFNNLEFNYLLLDVKETQDLLVSKVYDELLDKYANFEKYYFRTNEYERLSKFLTEKNNTIDDFMKDLLSEAKKLI
ncbi:hypothetical protein [Clostridium hydrogeniformans]|uniref:hypothetical protein n=1 Tax=Clostridium hydrogeniformans TaxID=349933 RepID=UPI00047FE365|nr:hypothetical protein [Clostridium hydrogeniformans]